MARRKLKQVSYSTSAATQSICGFSLNHKLVMCRPSQELLPVGGKNSPTRRSLGHLSKSIAIKLRQRCLNCGKARLVSTRFHEPCINSGRREKKDLWYQERDEAKRAEFLKHLPDPKAPHLVYVDESGMDERENVSTVGRRQRSDFINSSQVVVKVVSTWLLAIEMVNLLLLLLLRGLAIEVYLKSSWKLAWFQYFRQGNGLLQIMLPFTMANRLLNWLTAGCKVLYLPPYSLDLNRIERSSAWLKSRVHKQLCNSTNLHNAIDFVRKQATAWSG